PGRQLDASQPSRSTRSPQIPRRSHGRELRTSMRTAVSGRLRRSATVAAGAVLLFFSLFPGSGASHSAGSRVDGDCSLAAATQIVRQLHLELEPGSVHPVGEVLCGAFLDPGSEAMIAELTVPSCGRFGGFVAFRYKGGWRKAYHSYD